MAQRLILTIDSGGVRGIIPALLLAALEQATGKHPRDIFSMIAGTSAGAVLAALLAAGVPMDRIVNLYQNRASEVFRQRPWNVVKRIIRGYMYETEDVYALLREEMGTARDMTLNEAPLELLLTAKRLSDGKPWYFVPNNPRNSGRTGNLMVADCATASAAAPTFFHPWMLAETAENRPPHAEPIGELVDGAIGVTGNPVYQAAVEAFFYNDYDPAETRIISLGTGRFVQRSRPTWIASWLAWLLDELLASPGEQQTELVVRHFPQTPLFRLDPNLGELDPLLAASVGLDDVNAIPRLYEAGRAFAALVNWHTILDGSDTTFRILPNKTQPRNYSVP